MINHFLQRPLLKSGVLESKAMKITAIEKAGLPILDDFSRIRARKAKAGQPRKPLLETG
jgi:hypothetical protein